MCCQYESLAIENFAGYGQQLPPADDLCLVCQENSTLIMKSANLSEDEKNNKQASYGSTAPRLCEETKVLL